MLLSNNLWRWRWFWTRISWGRRSASWREPWGPNAGWCLWGPTGVFSRVPQRAGRRMNTAALRSPCWWNGSEPCATSTIWRWVCIFYFQLTWENTVDVWSWIWGWSVYIGCDVISSHLIPLVLLGWYAVFVHLLYFSFDVLLSCYSVVAFGAAVSLVVVSPHNPFRSYKMFFSAREMSDWTHYHSGIRGKTLVFISLNQW